MSSSRREFTKSISAGAAVAATAAATVAGLAAPPARAQARGESTWDLIKRTGKLRMGVPDYPPYYIRKGPGEWVGSMIEMGRDIAKVLGVQLELVEVATWTESILSVQAGKIEIQIGLQASPERAMAIDFAGPIYWVEWVGVNKPGFKTSKWSDYNRPEVKVAIQIASADEFVLRRMAPRATRIELKDITQCALAVSSGRADAFTNAAVASLVMKKKNPALGEFVTLTPRIALPGYIACRLEDDQRFLKFLNRWGEYNLAMGLNEARMRDALKLVGIDNIPEGLSFSAS